MFGLLRQQPNSQISLYHLLCLLVSLNAKKSDDNEYFYDNIDKGRTAMSDDDQQPFLDNLAASENNPENDGSESSSSSLSKNSKLSNSSKNDDHKEILRNNSVALEDNDSKGSTNMSSDIMTNEVQEELTIFDSYNSTENQNNTSIFLDDNNDSEKSTLWINATYQAYDIGLNVTSLDECAQRTLNESTSSNTSASYQHLMNDTKSANWTISDMEIVSTKERLRELGLNANLLKQYQEIVIVFDEICKNYPRELWFSTVEHARQLGITKGDSFICDPFKDELHPSENKLQLFAQLLNEIIQNSTSNGSSTEFIPDTIKPGEHIVSQDVALEALLKPSSEEKHHRKRSVVQYIRKVPNKDVNDDDSGEFPDLTTLSLKDSISSDQTSWNSVQDEFIESDEVANEIVSVDNKDSTTPITIEIDADQQQARMIVRSWEAAQALRLNISKHLFERHQLIGLLLDGICADFVPTSIDEFNATEFSGVDIEEPIGLNITTLALAGVNLTELAEKLRNDTEVDMILSRATSTNETLGGSFILPVLQKNKYDPFSAPIIFQGSAVVVRFGIYIESMSNFQTSTMDYDMDIFLMMAWRDARLVNPYQKAILVKEEEILEKIWRPDPFFANAKEASFHEVTFLNFLMRIYNDGVVLYETRIKLKPSCNLILCKYPHDKQTCELRIKSFAYPIKTVRFEWFSNKYDAIDKNPDVTLPELYIHRYEPTYCERTRKSGDFSCLRAVFRLKRDVGYHIAQTYVPTSLALMFSWVGVWLPEEFMEGRIGVAITVLLTLSTESAGAREHLPNVSYMKAIDLWFGFITAFVFITLLQTLIVITLDKRANRLKKRAAKKRSELTEQSRELMMARSERYHKFGRSLDSFCRSFYPMSYLIFLIMYYFVFTEGRQDDCVVTGRQTS